MYTQLKTRVDRSEMEIGEENIPITQEGFAVIYRRYVTRVYRYIYAWVGDPAVAEDLTAEVFMEALKSFQANRKPANTAAWLFTVARNKRVDHFRRNKRQVPLDSVPQLVSSSRDLLEQSISEEQLNLLHSTIQALSPDQRELLALRFAGGLTYKEMAKALGKREGAVKMRVVRLLAGLRAAMEV